MKALANNAYIHKSLIPIDRAASQFAQGKEKFIHKIELLVFYVIGTPELLTKTQFVNQIHVELQKLSRLKAHANHAHTHLCQVPIERTVYWFVMDPEKNIQQIDLLVFHVILIPGLLQIILHVSQINVEIWKLSLLRVHVLPAHFPKYQIEQKRHV